MRRPRVGSSCGALLAVLGLAAAAAAQAHHSRAPFQLDRTLVLQTRITQVRWSNPHVFFVGEVASERGGTEEWIFEAHSVSGLTRLGWTKDTLRPGAVVQMVVNRHRTPGKRFALLDHVVLADGTRYYSIGQPPGGALAARQPATPSTDFSGNWRFQFPGTPEEVRRRVLLGAGGPAPDGPYTARARAQVAAYDPLENPVLSCGPISLPSLLMTVYEYKWIRESDRIVIEKEHHTDATRVIHLKRTAPPAGYVPNPLGFSVGRFEPDGTLVVETTGFSPVPWGNGPGIDSSERKRIVERYRLTDGGMRLSLTYTHEDPVYFTQPLSGAGVFNKSPEVPFAEQPPCDLQAARQHLEFE